MVDSINTNSQSLFGLQNLNQSRRNSLDTQNEISSGRSVNSAKDNAALFGIAQELLGDLGGRGAVTQSLDRAISTADVSLAAGEVVSDLLLQAREKALQAADPGLDDTSRNALNQEFVQIREQITTTLESAGFNGNNPLVAGGGDISAISDPDGQQNITIQEQDLSLGGSNVTLGAAQEIGSLSDAQNALAAIDQSLGNVSNVLSDIGAGANRLQDAQEFNQRLADTTEIGIGNLVDSNLASASAQNEANQVREQLGILTQGIANRQPSSILSLFRSSE